MQPPLLTPAPTDFSQQHARPFGGPKGPSSALGGGFDGADGFPAHLEQQGIRPTDAAGNQPIVQDTTQASEAAEMADRRQEAPSDETAVATTPIDGDGDVHDDSSNTAPHAEGDEAPVGVMGAAQASSEAPRPLMTGRNTSGVEAGQEERPHARADGRTAPRLEPVPMGDAASLRANNRGTEDRGAQQLPQQSGPPAAVEGGSVASPLEALKVGPEGVPHEQVMKQTQQRAGRQGVEPQQAQVVVANASGSPVREQARAMSNQSMGDRSAAAVDLRGSEAKPEAAASKLRQVSPPTGVSQSSQGNRSLEQLLDAGNIRLESGSERSAQPAVARAHAVQQAIAHEHAAQAAYAVRQSGGGEAAPMTFGSVAAAESVGGDARTAVLSQVLAKSGEGAGAERATMIAARGLTALASQRGGSLAIRLDPPSLGEIAVRMNVIDGTVRADITAASSAARAMMEKGIDALRFSLESRGLTVERLSIHGPTTSAESHSARSDTQQNQSNNQGGAREEGMSDSRRDAAGQQSRGRGGQERQDRSFNGQHDASSSQATFQQIFDEDMT